MAKTSTKKKAPAEDRDISGISFLENPDQFLDRRTPPPFIVAYGDEDYLRREVLALSRRQILSEFNGSSASEDGTEVDESQLAITTFPGAEADMGLIHKELATVSMFGPERRLVLIDEADGFLTENRDGLEKLAAAPYETGTLMMELRTLPSNTRFYQAVSSVGLVFNCGAPKSEALEQWAYKRAQSKHQCTITKSAINLLIDLVGSSMGIIDQEMAKLAVAAGGGTVGEQMVRDYCGSWRLQTSWAMLDFALAGDAAGALQELNKLLESGEAEIAILAQIYATLRRLAMALRMIRDAKMNHDHLTVEDALKQLGVNPYFVGGSVRQFNRLGPARMERLFRMVTDLDFGLKGDSQLPTALQLERFIIQLAVK